MDIFNAAVVNNINNILVVVFSKDTSISNKNLIEYVRDTIETLNCVKYKRISVNVNPEFFNKKDLLDVLKIASWISHNVPNDYLAKHIKEVPEKIVNEQGESWFAIGELAKEPNKKKESNKFIKTP